MINGSVFVPSANGTFVPSQGAQSWRGLLAAPERHWVPCYSAYALAHCWEAQPGFPPEIAALLKTSPELASTQPLLIFPEWKVPLPGGQRPSQNDAWVLGKCDTGLVSMAVEGKVSESFDKTLDDWKRDASPGKEKRLRCLLDALSPSKPISGSLRYQLFHRAASAVLEAERMGAGYAVMLVHSFSQEDAWFADYEAFGDFLGRKVSKGVLACTTARGGRPLYLGWAHGNPDFLKPQP
jgi:hypothetical protein